MSEAGSMMIGFNPLEFKGYVNFFRIIISNPLTTENDLDFVLDEMERLGKDMWGWEKTAELRSSAAVFSSVVDAVRDIRKTVVRLHDMKLWSCRN